MKSIVLVCFIGLFTLSACNQNNNKRKNPNGSTPTAITELPTNFYKRLEGKIGNEQIVMHLHKNGSNYNGTYYSNGSWLELLTDTIPGKNEVTLFINNYPDYYFDKELKQPRFVLKWNGKGFDGNWISGKKDKTIPVNFEEKYPAGSFEFSLNSYQDSIKAFPNKSNSAVANISFKYLVATKVSAQSTWLNEELTSIIGLNRTDNLLTGIKNVANKYLTGYQKDIKDFNNEDGAWMNYSDATSQFVQYNDKGYVIVNAFLDNYSGGAHGSYSSIFYCLDVNNQKKLILSDVVKIDSNELKKLLEVNLRKQYNVKANEGINTVLFENHLSPNNNFYFNDNGIAFLYNPYEVASYAQGQIVVFIPYSDLKGHLISSFAQRMGLK